MTIVITGADGLLGRHLRYRLWREVDTRGRVVPLDRSAFNDDPRLADIVAQADTVVHLAGINRGDDEALERGNLALAERLVTFLERAGATPKLLYANSIQCDLNTPYGRGKRSSHEAFLGWSERSGGEYCELVLPHIFGEGGRPFYNSAVATFCQQLASGDSLVLNTEGRLELLHAQTVADQVLAVMESRRVGRVRLQGRACRVPTLAGWLMDMHESYRGGIIPDLRDPLTLQLFNTLRSYLYPNGYPREVGVHSDARGKLFEAAKSLNGGQTFLSTTRPGVTRGNHLHFHKVERFLVIAGEARIQIRRLFDSHIEIFDVSGDKPAFIDIPTFHTHSITNIGSTDLVTLFWSHELFDPDNSDTYAEPVIQEMSQS
jgi:UDP-2-acetamido-2,6-beta-L-arabino-hexul-4-ose reductase